MSSESDLPSKDPEPSAEDKTPQEITDPSEVRIYLLPNLMTAGNLFCGFAATLRILEGALLQAASLGAIDKFHQAVWFILGACIFDLLDGRLARLGGHESPFGREFDSIADIVSFGVAPALLVYTIVLKEFDRFGWLIAFAYLACGALRLARFNCLATNQDASASKEFRGFPIPAAAGVIASITLFMLWWEDSQREFGMWKFLLPPTMILVSVLMFSRINYPSFKAIHWKTQRSIPSFIFIAVLLVFTVMHLEWMPAVLFLSYLMYGLLRPWLAKNWRRRIERSLGNEEQEPKA